MQQPNYFDSLFTFSHWSCLLLLHNISCVTGDFFSFQWTQAVVAVGSANRSASPHRRYHLSTVQSPALLSSDSSSRQNHCGSLGGHVACLHVRLLLQLTKVHQIAENCPHTETLSQCNEKSEQQRSTDRAAAAAAAGLAERLLVGSNYRFQKK